MYANTEDKRPTRPTDRIEFRRREHTCQVSPHQLYPIGSCVPFQIICTGGGALAIRQIWSEQVDSQPYRGLDLVYIWSNQKKVLVCQMLPGIVLALHRRKI